MVDLLTRLERMDERLDRLDRTFERIEHVQKMIIEALKANFPNDPIVRAL